ncbi:MAG: hypothetical protein IKV62_08765 [Bacteroidales bacterium]|nr:hypothetical protein [Bacteroidales bacterium]
MQTNHFERQTYVAPETSVDLIMQERSFLSEFEPDPLPKMDPYEMYDEEF